MTRCHAIVSSLATLLLSSSVDAQAFVPDLPPGTTYHLAFVTEGTRDATSDQIGDYDEFVNAEADHNPDLKDIDWFVLGSTQTVDAFDHVSISGPIFHITGLELASSAASLFQFPVSSDVAFWNAFPIPEGVQRLEVWTGTARWSGRAAVAPINGEPATLGYRITQEWDWVADDTALRTTLSSEFVEPDPNRFANQQPKHLIAISGPLSMPIPEPSNSTLMFWGTVFVFLRRLRRWPKSK